MIYVIRHGKTDGGQKGNVPLSAEGFGQARAVAPQVAELGIEHIYSSDVLRAAQTAEEINKVVGVEITHDARLREFTILVAGNIRNLDDIKPGDEMYEPMVESFEEAYNRTVNFINELRRENIDNVAVVTHRGIVLMIGYYLQHGDFDMDKLQNYRKQLKAGIANCSINVFNIV